MEPYHHGLPTDSYQRKNGKWYWRDVECQGADDATFTPCNDIWAIDARGVFKQEKRLRGQDVESCRPLNLLYAKDQNRVYYIEGVAKAVVDVSGFRVLDPGQYLRDDGNVRRFGFARDSQNIYSHDFFSGAPKVLKGADVASFVRLAYGYAKDHRYVWTESTRLKADTATFQPLTHLYSKDQRRVFYNDTPLADLNSERFRVIAECLGGDDRFVYFQRNRLEDVDPATLDAYDDGRLVHDKARVYFSGSPVPGADGATFQHLAAWYYRDKQHVYYQDDVVEGADLDSFEVLENAGSQARDKYRYYDSGKPK